jgi:hypothetical protein
VTSNAPAHDFLLPRLTALVNEAVGRGFTRDVAVAVMIDLVTSPRFDTAAPAPTDDSAPNPQWDRGPDSMVLVNGVSPQGPHDPTARGEDDFIKPIPVMGPS